MLETNIRVVHPGADLWVWTKKAKLTGADLTPELAEKSCNILRSRHGLAAAVSVGDPTQLVVGTKYPIQPIHLDSDDWELDLHDGGESATQLFLKTSEGEQIIPSLIERSLLAQLAKTNLWNADSPRIWSGLSLSCHFERFCEKSRWAKRDFSLRSK